MTSHTRMLAGLALTAATVVTLSSDALARGGFGGMRSFSVARTPMVVRTTNTSAVRRTSATSHTTSSGTKTSSSGTKASQTKMHSCKKDCSDHHHKPPFNWMPPIPASAGPASGSPVSSDPASQATAASVGDVSDNRSAGVRHHRKAEVRDHRKDEDRDDRKDEDRDDRDGEDSESSGPQDTGGKGGSGQGGSGQEVVVNDRGGTRAAAYPVATLPSGSGSSGSPSGTQGSGGTISKERPNPLPPTSGGTGAAAASAPADAPNCVYERTVQRLPDGRLQRVVLKVCPDA